MSSNVTQHYSLDKINTLFCEAKWGGLFRMTQLNQPVYLPEIGSCISALFIIFIGIHMVFFWIHPSGLLRLISTTFIINGISSFIYHYTNRESWLNIDGLSMLFIAWTMFAYIIEEFFQIVKYNHTYLLPTNNNNLPNKLLFYYLNNDTFMRIINSIQWFIACGISWWMIGKAPLNGKLYGNYLFDIMFILPLVLSIGCVFYMIRYYNITKPLYLSDDVEKKARKRFIWGVIMIIFSAITWFLTEKLCDSINFFKLFPGHMLWHIIAAWGLSNCLLYASLLRADDFSMRASLNIGSINLKNTLSFRCIIYFLCNICTKSFYKSFLTNCSNIYFFLFPSFKFNNYKIQK